MCPVESYDVTCVHVFRAALLALGNQLVFSSLGGPTSLVPSFTRLLGTGNPANRLVLVSEVLVVGEGSTSTSY